MSGYINAPSSLIVVDCLLHFAVDFDDKNFDPVQDLGEIFMNKFYKDYNRARGGVNSGTARFELYCSGCMIDDVAAGLII